MPLRWFRPPFGAQSLSTYVLTRLAGLDVVVWGPHAADWEDGSPDEVAHRALGTVNGGEILLLHDGLEGSAGFAASIVRPIRDVPGSCLTDCFLMTWCRSH